MKKMRQDFGTGARWQEEVNWQNWPSAFTHCLVTRQTQQMVDMSNPFRIRKRPVHWAGLRASDKVALVT
jgi:hypothetical protein